ncbi:glycerol uptake facilitator protein [Geoalkalibacter ferrihydriticus]|uniref:Glycerol transporter n=2 Tax=Geoalkalibacter ferrihydriticus TaxID=392333 RepID=A0A0C2HK60_9BACT|nr:MIP/aquaporin family protein [Geoalkalibacter ferrihydriticus]KIH77461.1 glycerol transporter [Geoalkalibacter ferrihydriticus DSM 17813]SDM14132.1 glycerol uptake facilitator protein [Geoalkalibacter ferrihydriticus]
MPLGNIFVGEFLGTMILILLGNGVVANVVLEKSKGQNSGWIVISAGWGFGVAIAVYVAGWMSGAHINPAVTVGLLVIGKVTAGDVPIYVAGQFAGAFAGSVLVWLAYLAHWGKTESPELKLAVFCTAPAIRSYSRNLITEIIGSALLLIGVLGIFSAHNEISSGFGPYAVGILVFSIGLSLGGPTGYAINPARDLGPRIAHALLPIAGKGGSDWAYSWVPVVGPIIGGILGAFIYQIVVSRLIVG